MQDSRRIIVAMFAALAVLVAYQLIVARVLPPPPRPPAPIAETQPVAVTATGPAFTPGVPGSAPTTTTAPENAYALSAGTQLAPLRFGGEEGDALRIELTPRGAALSTLEFYAKNKKGQFVYRTAPHENHPYRLLLPVNDGEREHDSFATQRIWVEPYNQGWPLSDLPWIVAENASHKVVFTTTLGTGQPGGELLRLTKTYTLPRPEVPVFELELAIENTSAGPLTVRVEQDGPLGIREESPQYDMRRLLTAQFTGTAIELNKAQTYDPLKAATLKGEPLKLIQPDKGPLVWAALTNKYFAVYTRPLPWSGTYENYLAGLTGLVAAPNLITEPTDLLARGDLLARFALKPAIVPAGGSVRYPFEVYAGAKDPEDVAKANPAYADKAKYYYQLTQSADKSCFCTFMWLEELMVWLLEKIYFVVRNYGVAIIILVVIIRGLLHPLSVWQQKSMFRMQESMSRLQPKMDEIKQRYPNDKVKQNQEQMKLFAEEGVNPAANFVSFIPLFIQMPILVALWTALNTNVHLRLAPFDGWWIVDLSAPDALFKFDPPLTVPIISQIPLIGSVFTKVASFNLMPILMGFGMWLQQKYMPKPHVQAKLEAAKKQAAERAKAKGGPSPQDQMRQQQLMAYLMAVLLPLMFYKMPSGLNLYWFATTVFGIGESLLIRKQIDQERARRAQQGPPTGRKPGLLSRFFKHVATQAEQLQRKADEIANTEDGRKSGKKKP
jgi:YidC/Oxa1 family membrane protein insertase